jgi:hypothetical protein
MTTSNIIHLANILIDWAKQQEKSSANTQLIRALVGLRSAAIAKIRNEKGNDLNQ